MTETIVTKDLCAEMVRLRNQAEYFGLTGAEILREMTDTEMAQVCNGIGAEWMPEEMRGALDEAHPDMQAPCAIHDAMYAFLPGFEKGCYFEVGELCCNRVRCNGAFLWANKTLKENGYKVADKRHAGLWATVARWYAKADARLFRKLCDRYGALAWVQAKEDARRLFAPERLAHLQKAATEIWEKHK